MGWSYTTPRIHQAGLRPVIARVKIWWTVEDTELLENESGGNRSGAACGAFLPAPDREAELLPQEVRSQSLTLGTRRKESRKRSSRRFPHAIAWYLHQRIQGGYCGLWTVGKRKQEGLSATRPIAR